MPAANRKKHIFTRHNGAVVDITQPPAILSGLEEITSEPTVKLISVVSSEDEDGHGDGHTTDDIVIVDDKHFLVRAERQGKGDGRTYTATYSVTDNCGNSATGQATVTVASDGSGKKAKGVKQR